MLAMGHETCTFASAEEYLASGCVAETTCLITDLQMPGMSGLDLQDHIRLDGQGTPIVIVTAYPTDQYRSRALKNGAVAFLTKPVDEQTLLDCIERAIAGHA